MDKIPFRKQTYPILKLAGKMIFLFHRRDMLVRRYLFHFLKFGYLGMLTSGPHGSDGDWHRIDNARREAELQMPNQQLIADGI